MTSASLSVLIADDERPARSFLAALLQSIPGVRLVAEATDGADAIKLIERHRPDVALLDLQMPEVDGLSVVRLLKKRYMPLVIFVTAYDEYATKAFEVNAVDYLTKPVTEARLRQALRRAQDRLERQDVRRVVSPRVRQALSDYEQGTGVAGNRLERIPIRKKDDILLLPVAQVASIVADGELLHITTMKQERHTISYRLKDLEARLDPSRFVRLNRGALANIEAIARVTPMPGGTYIVRLHNGQQLDASRIQSRVIRHRLLHL